MRFNFFRIKPSGNCPKCNRYLTEEWGLQGHVCLTHKEYTEDMLSKIVSELAGIHLILLKKKDKK